MAVQAIGDETMPTDVVTAPNCDDELDPALLSVDEALAKITRAIAPLMTVEQLPLRTALGRILASDLHAPADVPNHTNSAMDGYAIRAADLGPDTPLTVIGTAWAGKPHPGAVANGECVRIMTGAVMPKHADTVVMQEQVELLDDQIRVAPGQKTGQHVRHAGEDLAAGELALKAGQRLAPAALGLIASLGIAEVPVFRRPRVAFLSNGDELRSIGQPLNPGEVYHSNRYTLHGLLQRAGMDLVDLGVVPDDRAQIRSAFLSAASSADALITSAGASVGDADFIKDILDEVGEVSFWKIAMKPGRPLAFGRVGDALFFGLPGNPVSVMVTFYQFVLPALRRLSGETPVMTLRLTARTTNRVRKRPGRTEFQRGVLTQTPDGDLEVSVTGEQGSGILSSMSEANCFILLPTDCDGVAPGQAVLVEPFAGLI